MVHGKNLINFSPYVMLSKVKLTPTEIYICTVRFDSNVFTIFLWLSCLTLYINYKNKFLTLLRLLIHSKVSCRSLLCQTWQSNWIIPSKLESFFPISITVKRFPEISVILDMVVKLHLPHPILNHFSQWV